MAKHRWKPELNSIYQESFNLEIIKTYDAVIDGINIYDTNQAEIE